METSELIEAARRVNQALNELGILFAEAYDNLVNSLISNNKEEVDLHKYPVHQKKIVFERQRVYHQVLDRKPRHMIKKIIR